MSDSVSRTRIWFVLFNGDELEQLRICWQPHTRLVFCLFVGLRPMSNRLPLQQPLELAEVVLTCASVQTRDGGGKHA